MNNKGSMSVFLVLLFVIMLGATMLLLECARNEGMKSYSEDILSSAADTLMTEYYRPLWDDYHVLFLAFAEGEDDKKYMERYINEQMQYSLEPRKGVSKIKERIYGHPIINPRIADIKIEDVKYATDNEGKIFQEEAVSYMKYKGIEKSIEAFKKIIGATEELKPATELIQMKMECDEQINKVTTKNLELIRIIDGVSISSSENYKVHIQDSFAKQLVNGEVSMNSVGIKSGKVWTKISNKVVNVHEILDSLQGNVNMASEFLERIEKLQEEYNVLAMKEETKDKRKDKGNKEQIKVLKEEIQSCSKEYTGIVEKIVNECEQFSSMVTRSEDCMKQACRIVKEMQNEQRLLSISQDNYRTKLENNRDKISNKLYEGLLEDCEDTRSVTVTGLDYDDIYNILEDNLRILKQAHSLEGVNVNSSSLAALNQYCSEYIELFKEFSLAKIIFDYDISSNVQEADNPISKIKEITESGLMELVLPNSIKVSKKVLKNKVITEPLSLDKEQKLQDAIGKLDLVENLANLVSGLGNKDAISLNDMKGVSDSLLMLFYQEEHFTNVLTADKQREHCLAYEEEYLICGHLSDKDNLAGIVERSMLWRTTTNFISIMSSAQKRKLAYETALLIAGVTGIEPLIRVTQTLIMLVWSLEEAMVDTAALLQGKEVPLLKAGDEFAVAYEDILLINHEKIQTLASKMTKLSGSSLSYDEFVNIVLFLGMGDSVRYRTLDLVNGNMISWHDKGFSIHRCVYGYALNARVELSKPYINGVGLGDHLIVLKRNY